MLEDLIIYKKYLDMMYYSNELLKKYPKSERYFLVGDIKNSINKGIVTIIESHKEKDKFKRLHTLGTLDIQLKVLKVYVRISYKYKYINVRNYEAFSRKITDISNLLGGWIKSCLKQ